jgi:hypothetical protein
MEKWKGEGKEEKDKQKGKKENKVRETERKKFVSLK